jgi:hypothetical protein
VTNWKAVKAKARRRHSETEGERKIPILDEGEKRTQEKEGETRGREREREQVGKKTSRATLVSRWAS